MIVLDALCHSVNYPLTEAEVEPVCIRRGLDPSGELTRRVASSREYELAYADMLRFVCTMVNVSQGGSLALGSAAALAGTANAIYRKYGEPVIGEAADTTPQIRIVED